MAHVAFPPARLPPERMFRPVLTCHPPDCVLVQAYGRAIDQDPARLFSLVQSGIIMLSLGNASAGLERHRQALAAAPAHVPALCGAAETLLALAKMHSTQGATGEQVEAYSSWKLTDDGREGSSIQSTCIVQGLACCQL